MERLTGFSRQILQQGEKLRASNLDSSEDHKGFQAAVPPQPPPSIPWEQAYEALHDMDGVEIDKHHERQYLNHKFELPNGKQVTRTCTRSWFPHKSKELFVDAWLETDAGQHFMTKNPSASKSS